MPMDRREMSPDSSTHISEKSRKSKKRKHKHKSKTNHKKHKSSSSEGASSHVHKKSKKHKKRTNKSPSQSDESEEEIFDIKPLSGYVEDRKQLHKEIFTLVTKKEVKDMLPETLKKIKFKEFKNLCLEQLEIMSQKRLRHVIAAQEMVSSSSDESTEPLATIQENDKEIGTNTEENVPDKIVNTVPENETKVENAAKPMKVAQPTKINILEEMSVSPNQDEIDELIEGEPNVSQKSLEDPEQVNEQESALSGTTKFVDDPSLMLPEAELKELEFRARALKSLVMARERRQLETKKQKELLNRT